jgi:hypothetical protein
MTRYITLLVIISLLTSCGIGFGRSRGVNLSVRELIEEAHIESEDNVVYIKFLENNIWELSINSLFTLNNISALNSLKSKVDTATSSMLDAMFIKTYDEEIKKIEVNQNWCLKTKMKDSVYSPITKHSLVESEQGFHLKYKITSKYQNCLKRGLTRLVGGSPKIQKDSNDIIKFYWKNPPVSNSHKVVMSAGVIQTSNSNYMKMGKAYWEHNPPTIKAILIEGSTNHKRNLIIGAVIGVGTVIGLFFLIGIKALFAFPLVLIALFIYSMASEPNHNGDMNSVLDKPREKILDCLAPLSSFERQQKKLLKKKKGLTSLNSEELARLSNSICSYSSPSIGVLKVTLVKGVSQCLKDTDWTLGFNKQYKPHWVSNETRACRRAYR